MTLPRAMAGVLAALLVLIGPLASRLAAQYPKGLMPNVTLGCVIETRPVSFGNYDALSYFPLSAQGQVIYTCVSILGSRPIRIELSRGGAGTYQRSMTTGFGENLAYNLYLDPSHNTVWGNGSGGTDYHVNSSPPNSTPVAVPIYARIPPRQNVKVGFYADSLYATILF